MSRGATMRRTVSARLRPDLPASVVGIPRRAAGPKVVLDAFYNDVNGDRRALAAFQMKPRRDLVDSVEDPTPLAFVAIQLIGQL